MNAKETRVKASDALKFKEPAVMRKKGKAPIRASELVKRRHVTAVADMQRAIEQREKAFIALVRAHRKIWKLARQVQRYENGVR